MVKALAKVGFNVAGRRGSHIKLKRKVDEKVFVVIVPDHPELAKGTLKSILAGKHNERRLSETAITVRFEIWFHAVLDGIKSVFS